MKNGNSVKISKYYILRTRNKGKLSEKLSSNMYKKKEDEHITFLLERKMKKYELVVNL